MPTPYTNGATATPPSPMLALVGALALPDLDDDLTGEPTAPQLAAVAQELAEEATAPQLWECEGRVLAPDAPGCRIADCADARSSRGFCAKHYTWVRSRHLDHWLLPPKTTTYAAVDPLALAAPLPADPDPVVVMTVAELAAEAGVSEPTMTQMLEDLEANAPPPRPASIIPARDDLLAALERLGTQIADLHKEVTLRDITAHPGVPEHLAALNTRLDTLVREVADIPVPDHRPVLGDLTAAVKALTGQVALLLEAPAPPASVADPALRTALDQLADEISGWRTDLEDQPIRLRIGGATLTAPTLPALLSALDHLRAEAAR